ncbi:MAG TPA: hypothetical protein VM510_12055, partial [Caulifigura sp.]|nr:hypothetical protein [Caulifigura sp.]
VEVARPPFLGMAEEIRLFLQQHEIAVVFNNENMGTMLPHLGTAIGIPVLVAARDAARASELLEQRRPVAAASEGPWYCGTCRVDVEPGFETCWSCGQPRSEVEQPFPSGREPAEEILANSDEAAVEKAEALVRRAWRVAIMSFGYLPMVGHLYSLMLLLESTGHGVQVSPECRKLFRRTFVIDLFAMVAFGAFLSVIFGLFERRR